MSMILYYSNYCEHSKKILQTVAKSEISKGIHFICIDKRVKDKSGKTFIILENQQQIILPEDVKKVPALLTLNNFEIYYGDDIYFRMKPVEENITRVATNNNMEPSSFSLCGASNGMFGIVSDQYSFLDMDSDSLNAKGDGGLRQMHSYASLMHADTISNSTSSSSSDPKSNKLSTEVTIEKLQRERDEEFKKLIK
jgi:hypothetical protein